MKLTIDFIFFNVFNLYLYLEYFLTKFCFPELLLSIDTISNLDQESNPQVSRSQTDALPLRHDGLNKFLYQNIL